MPSQERDYSSEERRCLLQVARLSMIAALRGAESTSPPSGPPFRGDGRSAEEVGRSLIARVQGGDGSSSPSFPPKAGDGSEIAGVDKPFLQERRGCFVTLRNKSGRLRGCIGTFDRSETLLRSLSTMAGAVTRDSRFTDDPVTTAEVDDLVISVRVLTPLEPLADPLLINIGTEGLYIIGKRGSQSIRGCFLPEVAVEQGWDATELVSHCCADKMDLPRDAWKPPTDLEFFKFRAIGVSE